MIFTRRTLKLMSCGYSLKMQLSVLVETRLSFLFLLMMVRTNILLKLKNVVYRSFFLVVAITVVETNFTVYEDEGALHLCLQVNHTIRTRAVVTISTMSGSALGKLRSSGCLAVWPMHLCTLEMAVLVYSS